MVGRLDSRKRKRPEESEVVAAVRRASGAATEPLAPTPTEPAASPEPVFQFRFCPDRFEERDFVCNRKVPPALLDETLKQYRRWLQRFFVCITDETSAMVVQLFYFPGTDRLQKTVCRSPKETFRTFPTMLINVGVADKGKNTPAPLIQWYCSMPWRRTARHVNMWTTPEDIARHPHDLNVFGGLRFDGRLRAEVGLSEPATPFADPFPEGPLPRAVRGLRSRTAGQTSSPSEPTFFTAPTAEWRHLRGLDFLLWHIKYVLCNADKDAFKYLMHWFAFVLQRRTKPGVLVQLHGEEGIGKSAVAGHNQSGPGVLKRIYEQYYQWTDDIDSLLGKFNVESTNKLLCCMEEAGTYRKGFRNNEKLKSLITEGTMRVEPKGVNAFAVNDHRAFVLCTNNRDALKICPGSRRFLCLEAGDDLSQKAVDEGRMDKQVRQQYMSRLDDTKNDDEVAYAFFRYCMRLDLSHFHVGDVPRTELFREQRGHNECIVKLFLEQVKSGEHSIRRGFGMPNGADTFTANEIYDFLKTFSQETGLFMNIDSSISLGCVLSKKYATEAPKIPGRVARYRLQIARG